VIDLFARKLVGWAISYSPDTMLAAKALPMVFESIKLLGQSPMERLFKTEWMPITGYSSFIEAENAVFNYIIGYCSKVRPHSYNGGLTPNESEKIYWLEYKPVASFT
jgi:putative transposase